MHKIKKKKNLLISIKILSSSLSCKRILYSNNNSNEIIKSNKFKHINISNLKKHNIDFIDLKLNDNDTPNYKTIHKRKIIYEKKPLSTNNINNKYKTNKEIQVSDYNEINKNEDNIQPLKLAKTLYTNLYKTKESIFKKINPINFNRKNKNKNNIKNPELITNYLKRKEVDNIPITFPLYLSFNNRFESFSQKERVEKNLEKLICLKTHLSRNPKNRFKLIKEFMLTNGINEEKYFKYNNMIKFEKYLKKPINFNPEYTMNKIIKNVINSQTLISARNKEDEIDEIIIRQKPVNYFVSPLSDRKIIKKKLVNKIENNKIIHNDSRNTSSFKNNTSFSNYNSSLTGLKNIINKEKNNFNIKDNNLKILVKNLEDELNQIKIEKINKFEKNNKFIIKNNYSMKTLDDKNKFLPNLCLSAKGFSEKYKAHIKKYNVKIKNIFKKQELIKNINNRMYYNNITKKNMKDYDLNDIRKNLKLTEFIVMKRGKQKLFKQYIENALLDKEMQKSKK